MKVFVNPFSPYAVLLQRIEYCARQNIPIVIILRSNGTADIKIPVHHEDGLLIFRDGGEYAVVSYGPREVYRLPGGVPAVVAVENVYTPITVEKAAVARAIIIFQKELREKLAEQGIEAETPEQIAAALASDERLLRMMLRLYEPASVDAVRTLVNPLYYADRMRFYFEKKAIAQIEKVLQLKIAFESGLWRVLKTVLPFILFLLVLIFLLPHIIGAFQQVGTVKVP